MIARSRYREILVEADFVDNRYDVSGAYVWLPYALQLRRNFFDYLRSSPVTNGYEEYEFPELIPNEYLEPQRDSGPDFDDEICWVTRYGNTELGEPYFLRPTGETQIYPTVSRWIRSYRDLPLRILSIQPMYRAYKGGTPLLSGQGELMAEGHEFHPTAEAAATAVDKMAQTIRDFLLSLGLSTFVVDRPLWGNYDVADRTIGFDFPLAEQTMMAASLYEQGDRYGDSYDITYRNADNESRVVHQLNWGIAARVLGLHLMANADDKGFRIPPDLSPIQVAFIPVVDEDIVRDMCRDFAATIDARTAVDDKGELYERFERWEQRGVPLRIEVGPEEVEDGTVTVFRRDTDTRTTIPADSDNIESMLDEITYDDTTVAPETVEVTEKSQIKEVVESGNVAEFGYCGDENCGREIESNMDGEILGTDVYINKQGTCLVCNTITSDITYASRRY